MIYIYTILGFAFLLLLYMRFEAGFVEVKKIMLSKNKNGLKVIQISDLHISRLKVSISRVKKILAREKPDMIVLTGDYIDKPCDIPGFLHFLREIKDIAPIHLCLGNHDYNAFIMNEEGLNNFVHSIENEGATVWNNDCNTVKKGEQIYNIIGFSDLKSGWCDIKKPFRQCPKNAFLNIAFSHNPDIALLLPKGAVDFLLCGHYHGGQIWTPFSFEFKILRNDKLCKMGIRRGLHKVNGINIYINKGLGNVLVPFRFLSRPEITVLQFP